jgi:DNA-binding NarL/FixJ family response regulator
MIQVLIAAPFPALRLGLRQLLESHQEVSVTGESPTPVLPENLSGIVDVLVAAGFNWEDLSGMRETAIAGDHLPAVLVLGNDPRFAQLLAKLPLRAWGVLPLEASPEECLAAIQALNEGLVAGAPHLIASFFSSSLLEWEDESFQEALTGREIEVLQLLARGLPNKQIASGLGISEHTVKFHISSLYSKMGAASRTEAVHLGLRRGLISL